MNESQMIADFEEFWRSESEDENFSVPTCMEVCPQCHGKGTSCAHLGAFTQSDREEMGDEWFEFSDDMRRGMYDRTCDTCDGRNVVHVVDEANFQPGPAWQAWVKWRDEFYETENTYRMERMMGA